METTTEQPAIKSLDQHFNEINALKEKNDVVSASHFDFINQLNKIKVEKLNILKEKLPLIVQALEKTGLHLDRLSYHKAVMSEKLEYVEKYENMKNFDISFVGVPFNEKMKFIKFAGYTKSGSGKNKERLKTKAKKMQDEFTAITGLKVSINSNSLEYGSSHYDSNTKKCVVMYSVWF